MNSVQSLIRRGGQGAGGVRKAVASAAARRVVSTVLFCVLWATSALGQEMSPRFYWPAPHGTQIFIAGYSRASGDVLMDPSIPLFGVDSRINKMTS